MLTFACTQSSRETANDLTSEEIDTDSVTVTEQPQEQQEQAEPKLGLNAILTKFGENPESPYPARIDSIILTISTQGETILKKKITKSDFSPIFRNGFINDGDIFRAEILKLDTANSKALVLMMYGLPNSDSHLYEVVDVIDIDGTEDFLIPAPYSCYPRLRVQDNLIATCEGVYTYEQEVFKLPNCCTVFSCLIGDNTFFYVHDDPSTISDTTNNAHYINLTTKDTVKSFYYDHFTYTVGYSTLMWYSDEFEKLTYLNLDDSTLTVVNPDISEETYELTEFPVNNGLKRDLTNRIYLYSIESMDQPIFVRFDEQGKPLEIKF